VLLSVLFAALPGNVVNADTNTSTLRSGLTAALTPSIADAPNNKGVMKQIWNPIVDPIKKEAAGVDFSNAAQREAVVSQTVPKILAQLKATSTNSSSSSSETSDTSFLNGATPALTKSFKVGFNTSVIGIYWIGLGVILLAFVISLFFKVPPLRRTSALQQQADEGGTTETGRIKVQEQA
jgi:hypothetical protein